MIRFPLLIAHVVLAALPLLNITSRAAAQPANACCTITAIDARRGVVQASITASGSVFEFTARMPSILARLRVGQAVQANFANNQVSLDGRTVCCTVTKAPSAPAGARRAPAPAPVRTRAPAPIPTSAQGSVAAAQQGVLTARMANLPQVTYGEPVPRSTTRGSGLLARVATHTVNAKVRGRDVSARILHVNGRQGIDESGLPDGVRRLLGMHVRKLPLDASQYYLVDPDLAAQWAATHPVPPEIKPKDGDGNDSECGTVSINGIVDCAEDAAQSVEEEFERARKRADDWWKESADKLAEQWQESAGCFADHRLSGPATPVKFSITPSMRVDLTQSGARGSAKGTVAGSATLGIPMEADFSAGMDFFYIPCLPFVFRPRSITADGSLTVGQELAVDVTATGAFHKTFTIPPTGGPQIPLYVIPIVIGNVPVAVLDVSAYIEGEVEVKGAGKASGRFAVSNSHRSTFEFACSGQGCTGKQKGSSPPATTNESAQIDGQVSVQPGIYAALQLSFDYNILQGRAGPQPYLLGVANGCGAVSATQSGGTTSSTSSAALIADLDWGVTLRAEALAGGQRIGSRWEQRLMADRHLWSRDMAPGGSSALVATATGPAQAVAAQPAAVTLRMPACYPYTDKVQYRLTWTGGATPAPHAACQWQAGAGTCQFDPAKDLALSLTWPNAGTQSVSVQVLKDAHRTFAPAPPPTQLTIAVGAPSGEGQP